ncbi:hypothetical protein SLE2022_170100 [Rubroshorea leprosula]
MGKTGKWLKHLLTGKKDKEKQKEKCSSNQSSSVAPENPSTPISVLPGTPKEKRRWSFRRSSATAAPKDSNATEQAVVPASALDMEDEQKKHAMAVAAATAAAADAAVVAAQAAAAVIRLTAAANGRGSAVELQEAAAIKIQSAYRAYLARKALRALKGLVKLQALVRGHLVRKQATETLRCMQALLTVQARARAQRIRMAEESNPVSQRQSGHRKSTQDHRYRYNYHDIDRGMEEDIKTVEIDFAESKSNSKSRNRYSTPNHTQTEHRFSTHYSNQGSSKHDNQSQISPAPSVLTDMSSSAYGGHFDECSFSAAQSSPQYYSSTPKPDPSRLPLAFPPPDYAEPMSYDYPLYPNYMANTESSRAKARSQSAPKSRPDSYERQPSGRRRASVEGRNAPRAVRMQRSSSHVGATPQNSQFPWSIKLDRSTVSLKDSECGSSSTVLTNTNYCRSPVAFDPHGDRY